MIDKETLSKKIESMSEEDRSALYDAVRIQLIAQERSKTKLDFEEIDLPPWYCLKKGRKVFMAGVLASILAENGQFVFTRGNYYQYENGVYKEQEPGSMRKLIQSKLETTDSHDSNVNDALGQLANMTYKNDEEMDRHKDLINLQNGMFDYKTGKLLPHSPDYLSTIQLLPSYDPKAECPRFMQYLRESVPEDQIPLIQEILGYLMIPSMAAQKSFILVGAGSTGKSVFLNVTREALLGSKNISSVAWQMLDKRFQLAPIIGKLLNIFADLPSSNIEDNGIFKTIVGGDPISVEKKHKDTFMCEPFARMLFSCNAIPKNYGDRSSGFYRRLIIIRFDNVVPPEKRDPDLLEKMKAEKDGIFLFAVEGLRRLEKNKFVFSTTERNDKEIERYKTESSSVRLFVQECCKITPNEYTTVSELYETYSNFCTKCGLTRMSRVKFNDELKQNYSVKYAKKSDGLTRVWHGIKILIHY